MSATVVRPPQLDELLPHELDAEGAVLSALLLDAKCVVPKIAGILRPKDFYSVPNKQIAEAVFALHADGKAVDTVTVATRLRDLELLIQVGGSPYLARLTDEIPAIANVEEHAQIVREKAELRRLIAGAQTVVAAAKTGSDLPSVVAQLREVADATAPRRAPTVGTVLDEWTESGPLLHEPTGLSRLDELTGGGPVYGTRWYLNGAPDAGKTALLTQIADVYSARGVAVGLLAVDEDAGDIVTRLAQRQGYARGVLEARGASTVDRIRAELGNRPLRLYDATWTIETAAADLAAFASELAAADHAKPRAALLIDSVQTVQCDAEATAQRPMGTAEAVTARVHAIRAVATRHRLIAIATSELGRSSYASRDPQQRTETMAAAKWSGAIEYSARVLLGIRSVSGQADLVEIEIAKNKHGPRNELVHLRIDRRSQTMAEVAYEPPPANADGDRDGARKDRVVKDAIVLARTVQEKPGIGVRELRGAVRASAGIGVERVEAALALLGDAIVRGAGKRGATPLTLDLERAPTAVREAVGSG